MKSKVFSVSIHTYPHSQDAFVYRTDGRVLGGGLRMYTLTPSRLIRLTRAMINVSTERRTQIRQSDGVATWWIDGVVEKAYADRAALEVTLS